MKGVILYNRYISLPTPAIALSVYWLSCFFVKLSFETTAKASKKIHRILRIILWRTLYYYFSTYEYNRKHISINAGASHLGHNFIYIVISTHVTESNIVPKLLTEL